MSATMMEWARQGARELAAFVWPQRCPGCAAPPERNGLLCGACRDRIPRLALPLCVRCLAAEAADPVCARHHGFRAWPAWIYDERAALVVEAFKYEGRTDLAHPLAAELARVVPRAPRAEFVTEVPLHPVRERERGYNQSALLAERLAAHLGIPRLPRVLERVRPTRAQARLGPAARRMNLRDAFRVREPATLAGRRVLLVDDVVTTGATLEAALGALRSAGARAEAVTLAWAQ